MRCILAFTTEDKKELKKALKQANQMVTDALAKDEVLPSHITVNLERVGVSIDLRKFYFDPPPPEAPSEETA